jgi:hypothetical protein
MSESVVNTLGSNASSSSSWPNLSRARTQKYRCDRSLHRSLHRLDSSSQNLLHFSSVSEHLSKHFSRFISRSTYEEVGSPLHRSLHRSFEQTLRHASNLSFLSAYWTVHCLTQSTSSQAICISCSTVKRTFLGGSFCTIRSSVGVDVATILLDMPSTSKLAMVDVHHKTDAVHSIVRSPRSWSLNRMVAYRLRTSFPWPWNALLRKINYLGGRPPSMQSVECCLGLPTSSLKAIATRSEPIHAANSCKDAL